ncbi:glycosyltransferase [Sphingobacterium siyangense]|uniref:glycosyltransferase n=1 Tax=Sphingobacterium siyangense TaxID=459529 RepID=UPI003DA614B5
MEDKVLILINHYIPGYKFGGPIRSIQAIKTKLEKHVKFEIITSDRDFGDLCAFSNIQFNSWNNEGKEDIYYFRGGFVKYLLLLIRRSRMVRAIYLNSFFNARYSILIILLSYLKVIKSKIVLAPRGEFNSGALGIKSRKKVWFLFVAKNLRLYSKVRWHATTIEESLAIIEIFGKSSDIVLAEGISPKVVDRKLAINLKEQGKLSLVFLARISKIKNLDFIIRTLASVNDAKYISLDIYGPKEDLEYWNMCEKLIVDVNKSKSKININYKGEVLYQDVSTTLSKYDFYILPTLGENFGQSIADSFSIGLPVIISDKTPWRNLQMENVGWDLPLDINYFVKIIEECTEMNFDQYSIMQNNCLQYAEQFLNNQSLIEKYVKLFSTEGG